MAFIEPPQDYDDLRFALLFFRRLRVGLLIKKSSSFLPPLIAATSQRGLAPRPAQVSPEAPRYLGGTFLPFNVLPRPLRTPPSEAIEPSSAPIAFRWWRGDHAISPQLAGGD